MKSRTFNIPLYDFKVTLVEVESKKDVMGVIGILKKNDIPYDAIEEEINFINSDKYNGGNVYRNLKKKEISDYSLQNDLRKQTIRSTRTRKKTS